MDPDRVSILIIYTGGTIGMLEDPSKGSLKPFDFSKIMRQIPEIKDLGFHIKTIPPSILQKLIPPPGPGWPGSLRRITEILMAL